jgi:hypothetical protein
MKELRVVVMPHRTVPPAPPVIGRLEPDDGPAVLLTHAP